jgi:hypothetical protein
LAGACEVPFEVFSGCELDFETTARLFGEEVIDLGMAGWRSVVRSAASCSRVEFAHSGIVTPPHDFVGTRSFYLEEPFVSGEEDGTHSAIAEFS